MSIWSNGTEAMMFVDRYCERCKHYRLDDETGTYGCPVTDVVILTDAVGTDYPIFEERFFNDKGECLMFLFGKDPAQKTLFDEEESRDE